MLYVGEELGTRSDGAPEIDIAVDPLEGTNLCATGSPGAVAVLAAAERGGLLHAPDVYMEKIVVGPTARGVVHLDAPVAQRFVPSSGSTAMSTPGPLARPSAVPTSSPT